MYAGYGAGERGGVEKRGRLDEFSKWRTMAFVVDIGRASLAARIPLFGIRISFHGMDTFSLPRSLFSFFFFFFRLSLSLTLFCEHSKRHTLGDAGKAVALCELAKSFSLCLDSFINRDVRAPSKTSRRRDNRSGSSRNSAGIFVAYMSRSRMPRV